jgi:formate/nitrite transporter FocA (FNT family)
LNDIYNTIKTMQTDILWNILFFGNFIGLIVLLFFYGVLLYNVNSPDAESVASVSFRSHVNSTTFWLSFAAAFWGCMSRFFVARVESRTP